jgi:mono/diheme cytochrome c family protein
MTGMRRRPGRLAGVALTLLAALALVVYAVSETRLRRRHPAPDERTPDADPARVARGRHLATAVAGCDGCHGDDLGGKVFIDAAPFGYWAAPNLTTGRGGAAVRMSDAELEAAIRHGLRPDGRSLHIMPSATYADLADDDLAALLGFLRQAPPIDRELPPRRLGPVARALLALDRLPILSAAPVSASVRHPPAAPTAPVAERGRYLARVGGCHDCHGPTLSGGPMPGRPKDRPASNLTPAGLDHYDEAAFVRALREGVRPGGAPIDGEMPWRIYGRMTDDELRAIWAYLRAVPPRPYGGR